MTRDHRSAQPCSECLRATFELLRPAYPALALALRNAGSSPAAAGATAALCRDIVNALAALNRRPSPGAAEERIALRRLLLVWMEWELRLSPPASDFRSAAATARASAAQPRRDADHRRLPPRPP